MPKIDPKTWLGKTVAAQSHDWKPVRIDAVDVFDIGDGAARLLVFVEDAATAGPLYDFVFIVPGSGHASPRLSALLKATGMQATLSDPAQLEGRFLSIRGNGDHPDDFAPLSAALREAA